MLGLSTALSGMFAVNLDQYSTPMVGARARVQNSCLSLEAYHDQ